MALVIAFPVEPDPVAQPGPGHHCLQFLPLRPVPDKYCIAVAAFSIEPDHGSQEHIDPLDRSQPPGEEQHRVGIAEVLYVNV